MSLNGTLSSGVVGPFKSLEQIENENQADRTSAVAHNLRLALNDYRRQHQALNTVLSICNGANVLPTQMVERKVVELIDKALLRQVVHITRDSIDDLRRVDPS
jgi:hypothetical protein